MKLKIRKTRIPFTQEEKRKYYETIKGSARIARDRSKYYRPTGKKKSLEAE